MALTLITGAANSGKAGLVREALQAAAPQGCGVLLVPTAPDVRDLSRELAQAGVHGVAVHTFDDWVGSLWALHGDGRKIVGAAARAAIVRAAVAGAPLPEELEESGKTRGFALLVADIAKRVSTLEPSKGDRYAGALARVLQDYRSVLWERGLIEKVEAVCTLASAPPRVEGVVAVTRFAQLDRHQEALLCAIARQGDVIISLAWCEGSAASEGLDALVSRLRALAARSVETGDDTYSSPDLAAFATRLFSLGAPLKPMASVSFTEAAGVEAECAAVAALAHSAIEGGSAPENVAVTFRDVGRRLDLLLSALDAAGVPHAVDVRVPFSRSPFGAALIAGLDACASRGEGRERLTAFLASPYSGAEPEWVLVADRAWRLRSESIAGAVAHASRDDAPAAGVIRLMRVLVRRGVQADTVGKWQELAGSLLANSLSRSESPDLLAVAGVDASAHRALLSAIEELVDLGGASEQELVEALRSVEVSTGPGSEGVLVTEAHRLRGRRFDTVILGGLTVDEFSPEPRESLALALAERLGAGPQVDERLLERAVFHTVVTRARRRLALVRQAANDGGDPTRASAFWEAALDVHRTEDEAMQGLWPAGVELKRASLAELEEAAPAYLAGRRALRVEAARFSPAPPTRGVLTDPEIVRAMAERAEFSVSEVEIYSACPYRWFLERAVRPRDIDAAFDAREKGSLAHELLAAFYRAWQEADGARRVTPADLTEAVAIFDELAAGAVDRRRTVSEGGLAEELEAGVAIRWARGVIVDDATFLPGYVPRAHEYAFGEGSGRPVEVGGVALRGFIDRIDEGAQGLVVTDYKSAGQVHGRRSFETQALLQAPVYAAVVARLTGRPVMGAVYRSLSSRKVRGFWVDESVDLCGRGTSTDAVTVPELGEEVSRAVERLSEAVGRMRSGDIAPRPGIACRWCSAAGRCGAVRS